MLDIIMCIIFLTVQNKYAAFCFICQNFFWGKRHVDNQKVQIADKIKRYVLKYLVLSCMHYNIFFNVHVTGYY